MIDAMVIVQMIDGIFTDFIFVPMLFILYSRFTAYKQRGRKYQNLYRLCLVLVILFLFRWFCAGFIFTEINYPRFTDSGLFPLIKAVFYPGHV